METIKKFGFLVFTTLVLWGGFVAFPCNASDAKNVKLICPQNGTIVNPGQTISITIESIGGVKITEGEFVALQPSMKSFGHQDFTSLPVNSSITIPDSASGKIGLMVLANDAAGNKYGDGAMLIVKQIATLQSLENGQSTIDVDLDWNNNIKWGKTGYLLATYGIYSDGIRREMPKEELTFSSSDPSVVSVDNQGNYEVIKYADATVTVSSAGVSKTIPLKFYPPTGIRPAQTIPPVISMEVQPNPNAAGWNNCNISIILTAEASYKSAGIHEIIYQFAYLAAKPVVVEGNHATIPFSIEGINLFAYLASDKEGNYADKQSTYIRLDKTAPLISLSLLPATCNPPKGREAEFPPAHFRQFSYAIVENLSGTKESQAGLEVPDISGFKTNLHNSQTLNVIIDPKHKAVTISAPNPQAILNQLKTGIFPIANGQAMHLNLSPLRNKLRIVQMDDFLAIKGPSIVFKVTAADNADNAAMKELPYTKVNKGKIFDDEDGEED